jgi:hypothetical protein
MINSAHCRTISRAFNHSFPARPADKAAQGGGADVFV